MKVPFLDLARLHLSIKPELDAAYERVIAASAFVGGAEVRAFEAEFAAAHGRAEGVGCANGTDAISLSLRASGLGPGDEVLVPAMTFFATAEAVVHVGATPVVVDVDPATLLLGQAAVYGARTERTRAVIPVHLYGHVVSAEILSGWADDGLLVIEDAAQAHLASWKDERVGSVGPACFSFYPGKNLGALGDGGAVLTDDSELAAAIRKDRDHGRAEKYTHDRFGVSSRLDGLQAAFLRAKLTFLPEWTATRRRLAERYRAQLPAEDERIGLVGWEPGAVHHLLVVRISGGHRDLVAQTLTASGIGVGVHFPLALSEQPALLRDSRPCPIAEQAAGEVLSLPMDPLMTLDEVDLVCEAVVEALP